MNDYTKLVDAVIEELEAYDTMREEVIKLTRKLNRAAGRGIARIVKGEDASQYLGECKEVLSQISTIMKDLAPVVSWNVTSSGTEEYAEFIILHELLSRDRLVGPAETHVPSWIWISALGDVIGELRRILMLQLVEGNFEQAKHILHKVQMIYEAIVGLEFSKSLVPSLRRKVDTARIIIERCESDFANAVINKRTKTRE